jgi:hypothetical protein
MLTRLNGSRQLGVLSALLFSLATGCDLVRDVIGSVDRAIDQIDKTTGVFEAQSRAWQATLRDLADTLYKNGQQLLANDLRDFTARVIGDAGTEFRCNADFIRVRLRQTLNNLKAALKSKRPTFDRVPPAVCRFDPPRIDIVWNDHDHFRLATVLTTIEAQGFDIDTVNSGFKLYALNDGGAARDVSGKLSMTTPYLFQITLAANGVQFQEGDRQLAVVWGNNQERFEIPVTWGYRPAAPPPPEMVTSLSIVVHTTTDDKDQEARAVFIITANGEQVVRFDAGKREVWKDGSTRTLFVREGPAPLGQPALLHPVPLGQGIQGELTVQETEADTGWDVFFDLIGATSSGRTINLCQTPRPHWKFGKEGDRRSHSFRFEWK